MSEVEPTSEVASDDDATSDEGGLDGHADPDGAETASDDAAADLGGAGADSLVRRVAIGHDVEDAAAATCPLSPGDPSAVITSTCVTEALDGGSTWTPAHACTVPGTFRSIRAGHGGPLMPFVEQAYDCGLRDDGTVACWGPFAPILPPAFAPPPGKFRAIDIKLDHLCGVRDDGTLACSGSNACPGCYEGSCCGRAEPPSGTFVALSVGGQNTCAIRADSTLACWGSNRGGESSPPAGAFVALDCNSAWWGSGWCCALGADHAIECWGTDGDVTIPSGPFASIAVGDSAACALRADGTMSCFNRFAADALKGAPVDGVFRQASLGVTTSCAVHLDGSLVCWGNLFQQCGRTPVALPTGSFVEVSVGRDHACALRTDGTIACFGRSSSCSTGDLCE